MTLSPFALGLARGWLALKPALSRALDASASGAPRRPLPTFPSPQAAGAYWEAHGGPYIPDPLAGALDYYTAPERVQARLELGEAAPCCCDCDDASGWFHVATRTIPGYSSRVVSLIDAGLTGSHVICVGVGPHGAWALDVNGFRALPDLSEATLCATWSAIYAAQGFRYVAALDSPYPW